MDQGGSASDFTFGAAKLPIPDEVKLWPWNVIVMHLMAEADIMKASRYEALNNWSVYGQARRAMIAMIGAVERGYGRFKDSQHEKK